MKRRPAVLAALTLFGAMGCSEKPTTPPAPEASARTLEGLQAAGAKPYQQGPRDRLAILAAGQEHTGERIVTFSRPEGSPPVVPLTATITRDVKGPKLSLTTEDFFYLLKVQLAPNAKVNLASAALKAKDGARYPLAMDAQRLVGSALDGSGQKDAGDAGGGIVLAFEVPEAELSNLTLELDDTNIPLLLSP